ncbi:hypothetical protein B0A55_05215 [Friedmanniomyces simplex]|uniref:Uncharacterized protein n=1 Tax=Friedmanniomyces simplex TaxID=329884 RepID=A0A4U0X8U8_9PEZI|nr:hypothetical protein B0A55_05215 [Friedmanniomyces simplex]
MQGKTDWESAETWQRVVASIIATGVKLDLKAMATAYGCTYDTLENRFRKIKKLAATLKEEVDSGERGDVALWPISKASPSKKGGSGIKKEQVESNASSFAEEMDKMNMDSFVQDDYTYTGGDLFDGGL